LLRGSKQMKRGRIGTEGGGKEETQCGAASGDGSGAVGGEERTTVQGRQRQRAMNQNALMVAAG
jgi:hypothetical protein